MLYRSKLRMATKEKMFIRTANETEHKFYINDY